MALDMILKFEHIFNSNECEHYPVDFHLAKVASNASYSDCQNISESIISWIVRSKIDAIAEIENGEKIIYILEFY